ncbi:MAG: type II secretion system major pseudopilin GspG [Pseudomonadales bacterium]
MQVSRQSKQRHSHGFTLIEIMVVLVILGLLAAIIAPAVMDRPDEARRIKAEQDIRALEAALNLYRLDNYNYPSQAQGLAALVQAPTEARSWRGPYVENLPQDPWAKDYQYANPGSRGKKIDVFSYGPDGAAGGVEDNADIGNWNIQ